MHSHIYKLLNQLINMSINQSMNKSINQSAFGITPMIIAKCILN